MSLYMATFGYKPEVWAGFVAHPENREETVRRVLERVGCKLDGLWYAFGENDGFALIEGPDTITAAGIAIAITASGAFRKFETTPVLTQKELFKALEKAAQIEYAPPELREPVHA